MNQSQLMTYSNYSHFGAIHSDGEIGVLLREPALGHACMHQYALCGRLPTLNTQNRPALGVGMYI